MSRAFLIAQLSDTHVRPPGELLSGRVNMSECLARAVERVNRFEPRVDLVMFTGDLVNEGTREEYAELERVTEPLEVPFYFIPGNHDSREFLRETFPAHDYLRINGEHIQYVIEDFPVRIVALDTQDPGKGSGVLDDLRLDWLERKLAEVRDRPTIVFMHHPPFITGMQYMDEIRCYNVERLEQIIRANPQVERIACGHVHRSIQTRWAGTLSCIAPSCAHQLSLELRDGAPARYVLEPSAFFLHFWRDGMGLVTHTVLIGDFPGPYSFSEG
jgi:3',5'-cyclic AMP phosphodiesterase CpdA